VTQTETAPVRLLCATCREVVHFHAQRGTLVSESGVAATITYADPALLVWECPSCRTPQAEELAP
jgi:hypothetical protein